MNSSASTILLAAAKDSEAANSAVVSVSTPYQIIRNKTNVTTNNYNFLLKTITIFLFAVPIIYIHSIKEILLPDQEHKC